MTEEEKDRREIADRFVQRLQEALGETAGVHWDDCCLETRHFNLDIQPAKHLLQKTGNLREISNIIRKTLTACRKEVRKDSTNYLAYTYKLHSPKPVYEYERFAYYDPKYFRYNLSIYG